MTERVTISPDADRDLLEIAAYIGLDSPDAALRFIDASMEACESLGRFPDRGKPMVTLSPRLSGLRWVLIRGFPHYIAFYVVDKRSVLVLRMLHGTRDLEGLLGEG